MDMFLICSEYCFGGCRGGVSVFDIVYQSANHRPAILRLGGEENYVRRFGGTSAYIRKTR